MNFISKFDYFFPDSADVILIAPLFLKRTAIMREIFATKGDTAPG